MKKRLLLILVVGVSFAPTVWASIGLDGLDYGNSIITHDADQSLLCEAGGVNRSKDGDGSGSSSGSTKKGFTASGVADGSDSVN